MYVYKCITWLHQARLDGLTPALPVIIIATELYTCTYMYVYTQPIPTQPLLLELIVYVHV